MSKVGGGSTTAASALAGRADVLGDLAGLEAAGADVDPLRAAVDDRADPLDVRVPAALRAPVRVAHVHAERRVLPADLAHCCHDHYLKTWGPARTTGSRDRERLLGDERPGQPVGGRPGVTSPPIVSGG